MFLFVYTAQHSNLCCGYISVGIRWYFTCGNGRAFSSVVTLD